MVSLCTICATRESQSLVGVSDVELDIWLGIAGSASPPIDICPSCNGILQCGSTIVNQLKDEIAAAQYDDVYGWYLSVQLSADILFRSYIQRVVSSDNFGKSSGLKELARGLINRAIVRERHHEYYPRLTMEVQFEGAEREVPDELMKAVNQMIRRRGGGKKFRTRLSVNIADVQQFIDSTKNDGSLVYKALFPNDEAIREESEMLRQLKEKFIDRIPAVFPKIKTTIRRETLFLVGKYTKTSREFGQSQWELNATSVSETICPPVCELFRSSVENCLFSASGREDMDVRMLGDGRAFVLQVGDAKRLSPILDDGKRLSAFNVDTGDVCVKGLRWVDKGVLDFLQWSTEQHVKTYRSVIYSEDILPTQERLDSILDGKRNVKIYQKTPLRVLHRRTENTREKTMYSIKTERLNDHYAIVTLRASAGAYIKEFIHSDFGRTQPSFCDIIFERFVRCDILQLDVLEVEQDEDEGYVPMWDRN